MTTAKAALPERIDPGIVRQAIGWLLRVQACPPDPGAEEACRAWLDADPAHELAWRRVRSLDQEWRGETSRLPRRSPGLAVDALSRAAQGGHRRHALKLLSVLGIAVPAGWLALESTPWQQGGANHATRAGERRSVTLADGSTVWLNTDSAIRLRYGAAERRIVLAHGEIHVQSGADAQAGQRRPLRVQSTHGLFEALGTRFVVREAGSYTRLAVEEGAVAMRPARSADWVAVARAGECYAVGEDTTLRLAATAADASAWIDGLLVTHDMPLADFLAELARHRGAAIACDDSVARLRLSGVYRLDDIDAVLALLPQVLPVRIEARFGRGLRVSGAS